MCGWYGHEGVRLAKWTAPIGFLDAGDTLNFLFDWGCMTAPFDIREVEGLSISGVGTARGEIEDGGHM